VRISCAPIVLYQRSLVLALITDVTDLEHSEASLRKSEERLRLALAASRMGVWEWDAQANAVFWSPECYAILGRPHIGDKLESLTTIVHPDDVKRVMEATNSAIANRTICETEFRVIRPDGEVRWLANFAKAKYDENGRALGVVVGTLRDITTQRQLAEELQQSQKMEAMGELAGGIAHGFNNILGVILGNVELAKADLGPEHPSLENLEEILEAARRAKDLVKQVLSLSLQTTWPREILEFPNFPSPHHGHGQHILYVDDERALVSLTKRALERLGYQVSGFSSPSEALRAFRGNPGIYDLVITDMNMPGSSGLEFARELLKLKPDVPLVLSSGYVTAELERKAREIGIRHVIYKPDTVDAAIESIRRLVPRHGALRV
jgi:PAS domain S-box-containing protein